MTISLANKPAAGTYTFNGAWTHASGIGAPTSYYHFDEGSGATLNDQGSANRDLTLANSPAWGTESGAAIVTFVEASNHYASGAFSHNLNTDITVALLVKSTSDESQKYFNFGDTSVNNKYMGLQGTTTNEATLVFRNTSQELVNASNDIAENTWLLMWLVWDADGGTSGGLMTHYYDDALSWDASPLTLDPTGANFTPTTFGIGAIMDNAIAGELDGVVCSCAIWSGSAFSSTQVAAGHNNWWAWLDTGSADYPDVQRLDRQHGPVTAARMGGVIQRSFEKVGSIFLPSTRLILPHGV